MQAALLPQAAAARLRPIRISGRRIGRAHRLGLYARNPHYPQAESAWPDSRFVTASDSWPRRSTGNGGEPSGHSPSEAGLFVPPGDEVHEAEAGRLTKPPPCGCCGLALERMRKRQASSSARVPVDLRVRQDRNRRGRKTSVRKPRPAESEAKAGAPPPAEGGLRPIGRRAGPGFAARELRNGGTGTSVRGPSGRPRGFGRGFLPERNRASARGPRRQEPEFARISELPSGEPPGLRPRRGARGEPEWASRLMTDPGGPAPSPRLDSVLETAPRGQPRLPGLVSTAQGQWGLAATPAPISFFDLPPLSPVGGVHASAQAPAIVRPGEFGPMEKKGKSEPSPGHRA
jgi:hypothetical protein